ncbi:MAG: hypothetical protein WBO19_02065, partial [Terriglobia bacterium]
AGAGRSRHSGRDARATRFPPSLQERRKLSTQVYHNLSIALDPTPNLCNGQPGTLARWRAGSRPSI